MSVSHAPHGSRCSWVFIPSTCHTWASLQDLDFLSFYFDLSFPVFFHSSVLMHLDLHTDLDNLDSVENNLRHSAKGSLDAYDVTFSLTESEGSLPPPHDSFSVSRWSDKWFLVHVKKLHIPPSRWTPNQTLLAEKRIIPYSTEIHWLNQNYSYKFGCQARETHRWLLEYRWISRLVWSLDKRSHKLLNC